MKRLTVPAVIWILYIGIVVVIVFYMTLPKRYPLNGEIPGTNIIHSELKP